MATSRRLRLRRAGMTKFQLAAYLRRPMDLVHLACWPSMPLRALIVDDNASFLITARQLLESEGIIVVGTVSTTAEALSSSAELEADVVLVDVDLGPESGFDLAERLNSASGGRRPVVLTSAFAEQDLEDLLATSSAIGFVAKAELSAQAIIDVLRGGGGGGQSPSTVSIQ
jgi:CheY-like chemotaxis protein